MLLLLLLVCQTQAAMAHHLIELERFRMDQAGEIGFSCQGWW